jgi:hypothetical protein
MPVWLAIASAVGAIFLAGALFGRDTGKVEAPPAAPAAEEVEPKIFFERFFSLRIPVDAAADRAETAVARGRISETSVNKAKNYDDAMSSGKAAAASSLKEGEELWPEPVTAPAKKKNLTFPMKFGWLVFSRSDAESLAAGRLKQELPADAVFSFKGVSWEKAEKSTTTPDIFFLYGSAKAVTDQEGPAMPPASADVIGPK